MTEKEYHDLLIRLDTRQESIYSRMEKIEQKLDRKQCQAHAERIKTLEKITWGAVLASIAAIIKSFWNVVTGA